MTTQTGILWIVASPSGGGKTSLVEATIFKLDHIIRSISFTTRQKRPGEVNGKDYNFISKEEFEKNISEDKMLEYECVFGNYYGTSRQFIQEHLDQGIDVVLTIDWQGSRYVKKIMPKAKGIFILPPDISVLENRLQNRSQDNNEIIQQRMSEAKEQISHYNEFDYIIVNDRFEAALDDMITIIRADRLQKTRQEKHQGALIQKLLS